MCNSIMPTTIKHRVLNIVSNEPNFAVFAGILKLVVAAVEFIVQIEPKLDKTRI